MVFNIDTREAGNMSEYIVRQGDCFSSIAFQFGFSVDKIWQHAENSNLHLRRESPNVLMPGDRVCIPEKDEGEEACQTGQHHRFRRRGVPSRLRVRLLVNGEPRANVDYVLEIDGVSRVGKTDREGWLDEGISPAAREGILLLGPEEEEIRLALGYLDPRDEISGLQARLNNLGFYYGASDGEAGPHTEAALRAFQREHGLEETGQADGATRSRMRDVHHS